MLFAYAGGINHLLQSFQHQLTPLLYTTYRSCNPRGNYIYFLFLFIVVVGKRSLRITGLPDAQHPSIASSAHETQTAREPLSPVNSSTLSSENSAANIQLKSIPQCVILDRTPPSKKTQVAIPQKDNSSIDENKTPEKMPIPMPTTPTTVSVAMRIAPTPASPFLHHHAQEVECSFEERRAGVALPTTY